jgi:hypothetical protein
MTKENKTKPVKFNKFGIWDGAITPNHQIPVTTPQPPKQHTTNNTPIPNKPRTNRERQKFWEDYINKK